MSGEEWNQGFDGREGYDGVAVSGLHRYLETFGCEGLEFTGGCEYVLDGG